MKHFTDCLKLSFLIIGSIIGAGFISGREIVSFFYGQNAFFVSAILCGAFSVFISFILIVKDLENNVVYSLVKPLVLISNFVIMSGMLSGLDSLQEQIVSIDHIYPIFSLVAVILSNIILYRGVKGVEKVNSFLVPVMIAFMIAVTLPSVSFSQVGGDGIKPVKLISYCGLNVFMSAPLFNAAGKGKSVIKSFAAAALSAVVLCVLIYFALSAVTAKGNSALSSPVPTLVLAGDIKIIYYPFAICFIFGIFTTLLSSHYPLFSLVENERSKLFYRILLSVSTLGASRFGFYNIVSYAYPFIGLFGAVVTVVIAISTVIFPPKPRRRTLRPQERTE